MKARGRRALLVRSGATAVAGLTMLGGSLWMAPWAGADHSAELFVGFTALADADGYNATGGDPKAQGYPQGQGSVAHTQTRLTTGPSGYALASNAWPGQFLGNLGALAQGAAGAPEEANVANYPVRAEAFSSGPQQQQMEGMKATAEGELAEAVASTGPTGDPGFTVGSTETLSRSMVEAEALVSRADAHITDVNIGEGTVTIDSIVTSAEARTDGESGDNGGRAVVEGMEVAGQPVVVDENGVRAAGEQSDNPADAVTQAVVDNVLSHAQMDIYMAKPQSRSEGGTQEYRSGSLVVTWKASGGDPEVDDGAIFVVVFGGSNAFAQAAPAIPFELPTPPIAAGPVTSPPAPVGGAPVVSPGPVATQPSETPAASPGTPVAVLPTQPVVDRFDGIGWLLIAAALAGSVMAGRGVSRFHAALISAPAAAACTIRGGPE